MTNFEWQTEVNHWEQPEPAPEQSPQPVTPRPRRRRRPLLWLALLMLPLLAMTLVVNRVRVVEARTRQEVAETYALVQSALESGDAELLRAYVPADDERWLSLQMQQRALDDDDLFEPLGLRPLPLNDAKPEITLSPNLQRAEVARQKNYETLLPSGESAVVTLVTTDLMRRDGDRWLWTAPDSDFLRNRGRVYAAPLYFHFSERDGVLMRRLAQDLNDDLARLCHGDPGADCLPSRAMHLFFSADRSWLSGANGRGNLFDRRYPMRLPTPSLVGHPADDAAYEALRRGYLRLIASRAIVTRHRWPCCDDMDALVSAVEVRLRAAGLAGPPLPALPPKLALPPQSLSLVCRTGASEPFLSTYYPRSTRWQDGRRLPDDPDILHIADAGNALLLLHAEEGVAILPAAGDDPAIVPRQAGYVSLLLPDGGLAPNGRYLQVGDSDLDNGLSFSRYDLTACATGECSSRPLEGQLIWSPDGDRSLVLLRDQRAITLRKLSLYVGDRQGKALNHVDLVNSLRFLNPPVWIDEEHFAYEILNFERDELVLLVRSAVSGAQVAEISLVPPLSNPLGPNRAFVSRILVNPADSEWLLLPTFRRGEALTELTLVNWQTGEKKVLPPVADIAPTLAFSPDGRWLSIFRSTPEARSLWQRDLVNIASGEVIASGASDHDFRHGNVWSDDGQWLLRSEYGLTYLYAPDGDYETAVAPLDRVCRPIQWLSEEGPGLREPAVLQE